MNWTRLHAYCWQSDEGYRIAAFRADDRLRYCAFAPAMDYEVFKDRMRAHYSLGEPVPQQCEPLGCFDDPELARDACALHRLPQAVVAA